MPKRPLNKCDNCGYTWYPKGKNVSNVCPNCKNSNVRVYRNWPGFFIVAHLLVFLIAIYLRDDLSWAGILQVLKAKRGWIEPTGPGDDSYLWEIGKVFVLCTSIYLIPLSVLLFKSLSKKTINDSTVDLRSQKSISEANGTDYGIRHEPRIKDNVFETTNVTHLSAKKRKRIGGFEYDVALSFAGEDREYADQVAHILKKQGIKVFYDEYVRPELWGQDLYQYLTEIYQEKAKYCVIFVSKHYALKRWTNLERKAAQARALRENRPYILPIKLDETEIPGLLPTVAFLSWQNDGCEMIVETFLKKLWNNQHESE